MLSSKFSICIHRVVFGSLDPSRPASATSVHCRVAPLVPIVEV